MKITATDLREMGIIEGIIPEVRGGAHHNVEEQSKIIDSVLEKALIELSHLSQEELIEQRYDKYAKIGVFFEKEPTEIK